MKKSAFAIVGGLLLGLCPVIAPAAALDDIVRHPTSGKSLREELEGLRSYQVGRTRIIYRLQDTAVVLVTIGPRKTIYQDVAVLLKQEIQRREEVR